MDPAASSTRSSGLAAPPISAHLADPLRRLQAADWDFTEAKTRALTHGLHPYPAKFIPQIPRQLIEELSSPGETVADVFCGSGTSLVEALVAGRHAVGVDASPLACLISEAKTARLDVHESASLVALAERARQLSQTVAIRGVLPLFRAEPFESAAPRPDHQATGFWFDSPVVEELAEVLAWCRELPSLSCRTVAFAAFSSIVVAVSRQDSDTRYVRRAKEILPGDTLRRFAAALGDAAKAVAEFSDRVDRDPRCRVYQADVLTRPDIGRVDLVVCSPPYPNAYSYHLYHMTRMIWLGMDQPRFKREEIGSHRKYSHGGPNGATASTFHHEMSIVFDWLSTHLKPGGYACFVVGDSTIRGKRVSNVDLISRAARQFGFTEVVRVTRRMQATKKAFNPAIGKIKDEQIVILRHDGSPGRRHAAQDAE